MRLLYNETYPKIEATTGVKQETCRAIVTRAQRRANSPDWKEIIACLGDLERSGAPLKEEPGTELSENPPAGSTGPPSECLIEEENHTDYSRRICIGEFGKLPSS